MGVHDVVVVAAVSVAVAVAAAVTAAANSRELLVCVAHSGLALLCCV